MRWLLWWRPPCLLRLVIVNLTDPEATSIQGVLWRSRGAWLTMRDAKLLLDSGDFRPIDGEVVLHRDRIAFVQVLP
jgi:hypothetical protein